MAENKSPLERVLASAEDQLWSDFEKTKVFEHRGVKGSGREGAVARFLREHLPDRFVVTTGQAVDATQTITSQLDLIIYDDHLSVPLLRADNGPELMPAEALLAVVEVKSRFAAAEARACANAVASLAQLTAYGTGFISARTGGADAKDGAPRCMYSVLAFETDIGADGWPAREWARLRNAASAVGVDVARIDRLTVLSRGLIVPPTSTALPATSGKGVLRDWFLHLSDFLVREASRRQPYDWSRYGRPPTSSAWERLEGYRSVNAAKRARAAAKPGRSGTSAKENRPESGTRRRGRARKRD